MKNDIKVMIDKCEACQQLRPSKPFEPIITTSASFPMEQLSVDLFHVKGKTYMVTADRYSGYIWIDMLRDQGTKAVTDILDKITRVFGIPLICRTDSGPQFQGPFDEYCRKNGIIHETSSPYNPRSNRHAEAAVKAAKYLLLKTTPAEFPAALAAWSNTNKEDKPSPNKLMFCRKVRDGKVIFKSHLEVKVPNKYHHIPKSVKNSQSQSVKIMTIDKFLTNMNRIMKELKSRNISLVSEFRSNLDRETGCAFKTHSQKDGTYKLS